MKPDIRLKTCLIVRKDGKYFVGYELCSNIQKWSDSPWDAWRTRKIDDAKRAAKVLGGILYLFNPIAAQLKIYQGV